MSTDSSDTEPAKRLQHPLQFGEYGGPVEFVTEHGREIGAVIRIVAGLTTLFGLVVVARMYDTLNTDRS